jgi:mannitol/fructose-specific phosphotransferase system IIA component (Ntr-type)
LLKWGILWFATKEGQLFKEKIIKIENGYTINVYVQYKFEPYFEYCFEIEKDKKVSEKSFFDRAQEIESIGAYLNGKGFIIIHTKNKDTLAIYDTALEKWIEKTKKETTN